MKTFRILGSVIIVLTLVGGTAVLAGKPDLTSQLVTVNPSGGRATVVIPKKAAEVAPGVFSLGTALDNGKVVEGYAFIDYKKGYGKPGTLCGNGICEPGENAKKCPEDCVGNGGGGNTSNCYGFLAKGAKWKTIEPYLVDPTNTEGLSATFITSNLAADIAKWEGASGTNILGDETSGIVDGADLENPDNKNEVYFADISSPGAIGVTIIWGIFRGPLQGRELVEWDQVYDDVDFDWSATGEVGKMDFENIATHELGHSVGLDDLYEDRCSEQTMYGYAAYGETKKRTLEAGDIRGVRELYK